MMMKLTTVLLLLVALADYALGYTANYMGQSKSPPSSSSSSSSSLSDHAEAKATANSNAMDNHNPNDQSRGTSSEDHRQRGSIFYVPSNPDSVYPLGYSNSPWKSRGNNPRWRATDSDSPSRPRVYYDNKDQSYSYAYAPSSSSSGRSYGYGTGYMPCSSPDVNYGSGSVSPYYRPGGRSYYSNMDWGTFSPDRGMRYKSNQYYQGGGSSYYAPTYGYNNYYNSYDTDRYYRYRPNRGYGYDSNYYGGYGGYGGRSGYSNMDWGVFSPNRNRYYY